MKRPVSSSSPPWSANNKRLALMIVFILLALAVYRFRLLLLPLSMAMILAYLVDPLVNQLTKRTPLTRNMSIGVVYLLLAAALISIPVSTINPIVTQVTNFIHRTPQYIRDIGEFFEEPIVLLDDIIIPVDQLLLDQLFDSLSNNLVEIVQTFGGQTITIFGNLATATISTVTWTIMVLFLSFYLVKDYHIIFKSFVELMPEAYQDDLIQLSKGISAIWNAFLRGQLVLCVVVGHWPARCHRAGSYCRIHGADSNVWPHSVGDSGNHHCRDSIGCQLVRPVNVAVLVYHTGDADLRDRLPAGKLLFGAADYWPSFKAASADGAFGYFGGRQRRRHFGRVAGRACFGQRPAHLAVHILQIDRSRSVFRRIYYF